MKSLRFLDKIALRLFESNLTIFKDRKSFKAHKILF